MEYPSKGEVSGAELERKREKDQLREAFNRQGLEGRKENGGDAEERKKETMKSRSEKKVVGVSSTSLFPTRKLEAVTRVEPDR